MDVDLREFLLTYHFHLYKILKNYTVASWTLVVIYISIFYIGELYNLEKEFKRWKDFLRISILIIFSMLVISIFYYFGPHWRMGRGVLTVHAILLWVFISLWRFISYLVNPKILSHKNILVIGAGRIGRAFAEEMQKNFSSFYRIIGFIDDDPEKQSKTIESIPVLGTSKDILKVVNEKRIDIIVFAILHRKFEVNGVMIKSILDLKSRGINVFEMPTFYKKVTGKVPVKCIEDTWLIFSQKFLGGSRLEEKNIKRVIDIWVSALALIILSPLLLLLAIPIKLTSKGPIFYKQERVGLDKKSYQLIKFRTMIANAEEDGPVWASRNDPRVTFIGRILRRTRLDEIPQFINVFKGDMSLVGPRPERPNFVAMLEQYIPYYSLRFSAKPGLTGWAQVNYQYGASIEDAHIKLQYDLYYIQEMSIFLDIIIMLKTIQTIFFHRGS
ncbi:MAG: sugar transferase [Acidobacteriota bacterium]